MANRRPRPRSGLPHRSAQPGYGDEHDIDIDLEMNDPIIGGDDQGAKQRGSRRTADVLDIEAPDSEKKGPGCRLGKFEYAVGPRQSTTDNCSGVNDLCCPAWIPRIGNMLVLHHSPNRGEDGNRIDCILGPYWPMMAFVTYPLILLVSAGALLVVFRGKHPAILGIFYFGVAMTALCLACTACRDPGLLMRYEEEPQGDLPHRRHWTWNDQAQTYRPGGAQYCRDCNVVVEEFDHTCPWTGTAIGRRNIFYFHAFTTSCCCSLVYIFIILVLLGTSRPEP